MKVAELDYGVLHKFASNVGTIVKHVNAIKLLNGMYLVTVSTFPLDGRMFTFYVDKDFNIYDENMGDLSNTLTPPTSCSLTITVDGTQKPFQGICSPVTATASANPAFVVGTFGKDDLGRNRCIVYAYGINSVTSTNDLLVGEMDTSEPFILDSFKKITTLNRTSMAVKLDDEHVLVFEQTTDSSGTQVAAFAIYRITYDGQCNAQLVWRSSRMYYDLTTTNVTWDRPVLKYGNGFVVGGVLTNHIPVFSDKWSVYMYLDPINGVYDYKETNEQILRISTAVNAGSRGSFFFAADRCLYDPAFMLDGSSFISHTPGTQTCYSLYINGTKTWSDRFIGSSNNIQGVRQWSTYAGWLLINDDFTAIARAITGISTTNEPDNLPNFSRADAKCVDDFCVLYADNMDYASTAQYSHRMMLLFTRDIEKMFNEFDEIGQFGIKVGELNAIPSMRSFLGDVNEPQGSPFNISLVEDVRGINWYVESILRKEL